MTSVPIGTPIISSDQIQQLLAGLAQLQAGNNVISQTVSNPSTSVNPPASQITANLLTSVNPPTAINVNNLVTPPESSFTTKSSEPLLIGRTKAFSPEEAFNILTRGKSYTDKVEDFARAKGGEAFVYKAETQKSTNSWRASAIFIFLLFLYVLLFLHFLSNRWRRRVFYFCSFVLFVRFTFLHFLHQFAYFAFFLIFVHFCFVLLLFYSIFLFLC